MTHGEPRPCYQTCEALWALSLPLPLLFSGQRDAVLWAEAHRPGGVQPGACVPGLLANHVQPGGHAAGQGDGLLQRGGEFLCLCVLVPATDPFYR